MTREPSPVPCARGEHRAIKPSPSSSRRPALPGSRRAGAARARHDPVAAIKAHKRGIVTRYAKPETAAGLVQVANTLLPLAVLWYLAALGASVSWGLTVLATLAMSLFLLRVFVLMHECGHESLFRGAALNRRFGFVMGVVSGMPQYVWAQHHNFHHTTNGNWDKYRGALAILSVDEYDALDRGRQLAYARARGIVMAPLGGFVYLILNPRLTWINGTAGLLLHVLRGKLAQPQLGLREHAAAFRTRYWKNAAEYRHMTLNNLVLLGTWALMAWLVGPLLFFAVYLVSTSFAGAAGLILFTVQHNFEHSYASGDHGWDYDTAALEGTSFLVLPGWLNWFTASIGYHHVHHLCARIPNHRLVECHAEHAHLFTDVPRLHLPDIAAALKFILWDPRARRIVSVAEHEASRPAPAAA